jgi:glycogen debranching enzyme
VALAVGLHKFREAAHLLREASALKTRFNRLFWMPNAKFYALALDAKKRHVGSVSSNPGHCLATGIIDGARAAATAERLMAPDMFSGWGVRTLSAEHPAYNPLSYQLGSVWPVEQASIAFGFKRYGFHDRTCDLARAVFDAAALFPHHRLPEVIGGYPRDAQHPHPGIYPQAQSPQAWSASALFCLVQAMLGLRPFAPLNLLLIDPALPDWLPDVTLHDLRVGDTTMTLRFQRKSDGHTSWKVVQKRGGVRVVQQPPESSVHANLLDRATSGVRSFLPLAH